MIDSPDDLWLHLYVEAIGALIVANRIAVVSGPRGELLVRTPEQQVHDAAHRADMALALAQDKEHI